MEFIPFPKIARLNRTCVITEKIDGNNAGIQIEDLGDERLGWTDETSTKFTGDPHVTLEGRVYRLVAQSRNRLIFSYQDNYGFARWVKDNATTLVEDLGPGVHFGEWWGQGIQRGYGLTEKRFSLFNAHRWKGAEFKTPQLRVVPVLHHGVFTTAAIEACVNGLRKLGSFAAPGFMNPEGIVIYHEAARTYFKVTCKNDEKPKGSTNG